jgi:uncharacterized membrane protein
MLVDEMGPSFANEGGGSPRRRKNQRDVVSMASLSRAKILGEISSIMVVLTVVPSIGTILAIVGFILMLVSIKEISDIVTDRSIFNNMLLAVGLAIAGIVLGVLVVVGSVLRFIGLRSLSMGPNFNTSSIPTGDLIAFIGTVVIGLAVVWVMLLASGIFVRRSYGSIASRLNVNMFATAGLVYVIGAATTIVLVGFFILFVAQVLVIVSFFLIDEKSLTAAETANSTGSGTPI